MHVKSTENTHSFKCQQHWANSDILQINACRTGLQILVQNTLQVDVLWFFFLFLNNSSVYSRGLSGCAVVLDTLPVPGIPLIWIMVGQGIAVLVSVFFPPPSSPPPPPLSLSGRRPEIDLNTTSILKVLLNPKQPTNRGI